MFKDASNGPELSESVALALGSVTRTFCQVEEQCSLEVNILTLSTVVCTCYNIVFYAKLKLFVLFSVTFHNYNFVSATDKTIYCWTIKVICN